MLLSQITSDPAAYQNRDKPYSEETVAGMVAEGLDTAKFDPIPVTMRDGAPCVGGDGHSRLRGCQLLAAENRLPAAWRVGADWDIPCRVVSADEARKLSWTANLSRSEFSATEEAKIYRAMLAEKMDLEEVAKLAHKSTSYVRRMLPLNDLAGCIRERIGKSPDAGGIDKSLACTMAELFARYQITPQQQQEFFGELFAHSELTPSLIRGAIHKVCAILEKQKGRDNPMMLFAPRACVREAMAEIGKRAKLLARAERGLAALLGTLDSDALDGVPDLKALLLRRGDAMLMQLKAEADSDGAALGAQLVA